MNWIASLYQTYDNCESEVGIKTNPPLLPIAHVPQQVEIEISINQKGDFVNALVLSADELPTIIPCTEASAGRTNSPEPHPLADSLKYVAADFYELTSEKAPADKEDKPVKTHHEHYVELLTSWAEFDGSNAKLDAILSYVQKGTVLRDLVSCKIFPILSGKIQKSWTEAEKNHPPLFGSKSKRTKPWDAFVRWSVNIPNIQESQTYWDRELWNSWISYYRSTLEIKDLCYVTGDTTEKARQHPRKIRYTADGAKLISSNDSSGFTFRGRFTDKEGTQTCGVSFEVTQKAHNALRWLIARQGKRFGDQAIVAWALTGQKIPDPLVSTADLSGKEDDFLEEDLENEADSLGPANTGQTGALILKRKISGYRADLGNTTNMVVLALESATKGRMAISYYRELSSGEFLGLIEKWHSEGAWDQNFGKDKEFVGVPSPYDIAQAVYGRRLDDDLKAVTCRRLLPCIIEDRPVPVDLVETCVHQAIARQSLEPWEWEKTLGIACALYRKQQIQTYKKNYAMSLERTRNSRSYLYGRLLAVADVLEKAALTKEEDRRTNAARLMQRFASRPYDTWTSIYLSLEPYCRRLKAKTPGLLHLYETEIDEIKNLFDTDEYCDDSKLDGEFLLAYHCQRTALYTSNKPKNNKPNSNS